MTRDQAKILNYGRIYGAGEPFAKLLLMQFNPSITETEAASRAKHMYQQTKGNRAHILNRRGGWVQDQFTGKKKYGGELVNSGEVSVLANIMTKIQQIVETESARSDISSAARHDLTDLGLELLVSLGHNPAEQVDTEQLAGLVRAMRGRTSKTDLATKDSLVERVVWSGGSESATFNRLEEIAMSPYPTTPVLKANITR